MPFGGLTHILDGGQEQTNPFANVRGDKTVMQPFGKIIWPHIHYLTTLLPIACMYRSSLLLLFVNRILQNAWQKTQPCPNKMQFLPQCRYLVNWTKYTRLCTTIHDFDRDDVAHSLHYVWHDVISKTKSKFALLSQEGWATATSNIYRKLDEIWMFFWHVNRQTDRDCNTLHFY